MITIEVDDQQVRQALTRLVDSAENPTPVLRQIGELLVDSTKQRFATSTAPDGSRWAENSDVTLLHYLGSFRRKDGSSTSFRKNKKDGSLTQKGAARLGGKKPLIDGGELSRNISPKIEGSTLIVGSSMEYAAAQQFGMKKGYAGANKRGSPIPWGDIPARPFLGISDQDQRMILDEISDYLSRSFRP